MFKKETHSVPFLNPVIVQYSSENIAGLICHDFINICNDALKGLITFL